jgi:hypothetical protein
MSPQRSCGNSPSRVSETPIASSVPSMRIAPLWNDCPAPARLITATAKAAHIGFSQPMDSAMP